MRPVLVAGTRPEIVKLWPVYLRFLARGVKPLWIHSGQHDGLALPLYKELGLEPDLALELPQRSSDLAFLGSLLLDQLSRAFESVDPDIVIVQGDTHTVLYGGLAAFYRGTPVAHVEAGLRTYKKGSPFPEEVNRQIVARLATYHFCPTEKEVSNLWCEHIYCDDGEDIYVVGNTIVDAVDLISKNWGLPRKDHVIVTLHRRENIDDLEDILLAIEWIAREGYQIIFPVHASPAVCNKVYRTLQGIPGISLVRPLLYPQFLELLFNALAVVTDSGGIQEEAVTLRKPLIVCRDTTERYEAIRCGCGILAGKNPEDILEAFHQSLERNIPEYDNPFGDGMAAEYIVDTLLEE